MYLTESLDALRRQSGTIMLLIDQVQLLQKNLPQLTNFKACLPLLGGVSQVQQAYHFIYLIHPARDIMTSIKRADPSGSKLPKHLRGWNLWTQDGHGNDVTMDFKDLLGMLVHVYYFRIDGNVLDVSNDRGRRTIIDYSSFLVAMRRLILPPAEVALIACHLALNVYYEHAAELRDSNRNSRKLRFPPDDIPGTGDFSRLLWEIRRWPDVLEAVWVRFFESKSKTLEDNANVIDNQPFKYGRRVEPNGDYRWCLGWRRGAVIAKIEADPASLIEFVRTHIETIISEDRNAAG